jgi:multidrug transporter EmrE-like cation transporter
MKRAVIAGFLLLLTIDTTQQVITKIASDRIGAFAADARWLERLLGEPLLLVVLGCYLLAFLVYSWLLKFAPVGPSYAAVHGHVVTVLLVSLLAFGERLTLVQAMGCLLIVAGIVVLAVTEEL